MFNTSRPFTNSSTLHLFYVSVLAILFFIASPASAYFYVPIPGADGAASQYICKQQAGLTSTIQEVKPGGVIVERTTSYVSKSLDKQIRGLKTKLATVQSAIRGSSGNKRKKLLARKAALSAQIKSLKSIKAKVTDCSKSKLFFAASGSPMFLSKTFPDPRPGYSGMLSGFLFGFLFTPPKNATGEIFCGAISGASKGLASLAGSTYPEFTETSVYIRGNCIALGGVEFCAPGFEKGQLMVVLAQGIISEAPGTCSPPERCSITEAETKLASAYAGATLHSLRPTSVGKYCF